MALDFLNTAPGPGKPDELDRPGGAAAWMSGAGLIRDADVRALADLSEVQRASAGAAVLSFRDSVRATLLDGRVGSPASVRALSREIDRALACDDSRLHAVLAGDRLVPERRRRWRSGRPLVAILAEAILDLAAGAAPGRIRRCDAPDCVLLFVDRTASNRRRWCSMQLCGNRAKVRHLRQRRAAGGD